MPTDTDQNTAFNRIYRLDKLFTHHSIPFADEDLYIPPWNNDYALVSRRIWLHTPVATPELHFMDKVLTPVAVHDGENRWLDYGFASIPSGPNVQFMVNGLGPADAAASHLIISVDPELNLVDKSLGYAEECLFGISSDQLGHSRISPSTVTTGDPVTFQLEYTTGPIDLPVGFFLRLTWPRCFAFPQVTEPEQPGYLTVSCPAGQLTEPTIDFCFESNERVDAIFEITEAIPAGSRLNFTYFTDKSYLIPSVWNESSMTHWFSPVPPMLVSVCNGQNQYCWSYLAPEQCHNVEFVPGPAAELHLFLPGRRVVGSSLKLKGTVTDRCGNPINKGAVFSQTDYWLTSGTERNKLDISEAAFPTAYRFSLELPQLPVGVYRVEACHSETGKLISRSNPLEIVAEDQEDRQLFWGGIHTHSNRSDGIGSFESLYQHGRDAAHLEFAAAADHITRISTNSWAQCVDITNAYNQPGEFTTLIGYEFQDSCVYTSQNSLQPIKHQDQSPLKLLTDLYQGRSDIVMGPHGHTNHLDDFHPQDLNLQRFVQVYGTFGGCDAWDNPFLFPLETTSPKPKRVATDYLDEGHKLGFTGGGDIHCARPGLSPHSPIPGELMACDQYYSHLFQDGLTAINSRKLDRTELLDALRNRQMYATSGPRILLEFSICGKPMGSEIQTNCAVCHLDIHGVDTIDKVDIIKNGKVVWQQQVGQLDADITWEDPEPGQAYYYVRVYQVDKQMAWSSPIWVSPERV